MSEQQDLREAFIDTLDHIDGVCQKLRANAGIARPFAFPDQHKLTEGLFLSAWTHWEQLLRSVMLVELATNATSTLAKRVRSFRSKRASHYLAEQLLDHPDENRFVEWSSIDVVLKRAESFLGTGSRFAALDPHKADLNRLKRIRNAIAHKSDDAWSKFRQLVQGPPFTLQPKQMKGLTPGRFLSSHQWQGVFAFEKSTQILRSAANSLVP